MWFITALLVILVFLLLVVIMDTSMKLALMITTLYNYDSKKLFIPACLTVIIWGLLILACFRTINKSLDYNAVDMLFSMLFDKTIIEGYKGMFARSIISTFLVGTVLQSFTYYSVNINYQKVTGTIRFSLKKLFKAIIEKIFKKKNNDVVDANASVISKRRGRLSSNIKALAEVKREPKKLTFPRAILTSVISVLFTLLICYGLFKIGTLLSGKVMTIIGKIL
ncbi:MAG: hypothetical protein IKD74_06100 [Clostridia bacterium]|jgi:hypothetical protein|nr:hypothetical protein [Clostridia bacterium]